MRIIEVEKVIHCCKDCPDSDGKHIKEQEVLWCTRKDGPKEPIEPGFIPCNCPLPQKHYVLG